MLKKKRWNWVWHGRIGPTAALKIVMRWAPAGKRNRGRPTKSRRQSVEEEIKMCGRTLG